MYTLGINAAFHDSSAAILRDGLPIAAAEDERFTRIKHGKRPVPFLSYQLPFHAIDYCLREAGIPLSAVDHIAYSFDPSLALDGIDPRRFRCPWNRARGLARTGATPGNRFSSPASSTRRGSCWTMYRTTSEAFGQTSRAGISYRRFTSSSTTWRTRHRPTSSRASIRRRC
jgi:hypothetical protein